MKKYLLAVSVALFFCHCVHSQSPNAKLKYVTIDNTRSKFSWKNHWSVFVADAIDRYGSILLNTDSLPMAEIISLCPRFQQATKDEKKIFWALFIAAIAKYESNFDPNTRYLEGPPLNVYSEGLLQLSYGDEKRYKDLPIDPRKKNILYPDVNLSSGVIILSNQIRKKHVLFTSKHFYWKVLTTKQVEIKKFISDHIMQAKFCK